MKGEEPTMRKGSYSEELVKDSAETYITGSYVVHTTANHQRKWRRDPVHWTRYGRQPFKAFLCEQ